MLQKDNTAVVSAKKNYQISLKAHTLNLLALGALILFVSYLIRFTFLIWSLGDLNNIGKITLALITGGVFDVSVIVYSLVPFALIPFLIPKYNNIEKATRVYKITFFSFLTFFLLIGIFLSIAELVFWNEFHSRFNFIAVDYLIYTHEVLRNIWESYPVVFILAGVIGVSLTIAWYFGKKLKINFAPHNTIKNKALYVFTFIFALTINYVASPTVLTNALNDFRLTEISKNGIYSLFEAYFANQLDYEKFYLSYSRDEVFKEVRSRLEGDSSSFTKENDNIGRLVSSPNPKQNYNVILVSMESMSASFMKAFGNTKNITPNLDSLSEKGLHFSNLFATGTRTVRGLEALMLSVPPTPGQSILRRPRNENLYSLGSYLAEAKYSTEFLYGGFSYFDNMRQFFSSNGMEVWDRANIKKSEITFSNAWGVCDEDLYKLSLDRADVHSKAGQPFFQLVMTTSNHRPYTYPSDRIDIPSGTGRDGAVKYSDYAIGDFLKKAEKKSWFKNTIFIFVADHDGSVSGKSEVPVADYRIPFIIYAPGIIKPQTITKLGSQIDVAPTLLSLLNFTYRSHLFGHNLLNDKTEERAFISNYQTLGLLKEATLTLLGPNKKVEQFDVDAKDNLTNVKNLRSDLLRETVSYYQSAFVLFNEGKMTNNSDQVVKNTKLAR